MERNDLHRCIAEHRDVGPFRWLPDAVTLEPSGVEFVQFELNKLHQEHGNGLIPCQLTHDPCRPRDAHAMQIRTIEYVIGYVPDHGAGWWQRQFDQLGDPRTRLVGLCRIDRLLDGELQVYRPTCQFRVRFASRQLQLL